MEWGLLVPAALFVLWLLGHNRNDSSDAPKDPNEEYRPYGYGYDTPIDDTSFWQRETPVWRTPGTQPGSHPSPSKKRWKWEPQRERGKR